jgi:hypothetical protein
MPTKAKPSAAARPSAAEKGGWGVSPDCYSATRLCANKAKRCDQQRKEGDLSLQQQPTRIRIKNNRRETYHLQDKDTQALL